MKLTLVKQDNIKDHEFNPEDFELIKFNNINNIQPNDLVEYIEDLRKYTEYIENVYNKEIHNQPIISEHPIRNRIIFIFKYSFNDMNEVYLYHRLFKTFPHSKNLHPYVRNNVKNVHIITNS